MIWSNVSPLFCCWSSFPRNKKGYFFLTWDSKSQLAPVWHLSGAYRTKSRSKSVILSPKHLHIFGGPRWQEFRIQLQSRLLGQWRLCKKQDRGAIRKQRHSSCFFLSKFSVAEAHDSDSRGELFKIKSLCAVTSSLLIVSVRSSVLLSGSFFPEDSKSKLNILFDVWLEFHQPRGMRLKRNERGRKRSTQSKTNQKLIKQIAILECASYVACARGENRKKGGLWMRWSRGTAWLPHLLNACWLGIWKLYFECTQCERLHKKMLVYLEHLLAIGALQSARGWSIGCLELVVWVLGFRRLVDLGQGREYFEQLRLG